jgi:hypothetical protein
MMTTERTAIRRRLAIRRTAHRPPWSGRKLGHRSIVAPLAATLAAGRGRGGGGAGGGAAPGRRALGRQRSRERRFALAAGEPLGEGLRRIALGQLDLAIEALESVEGPATGDGRAERAVHDTRKALKRLRTIVRLLRSELGEQAYTRENTLLRDAGRRLARARDAQVLLDTLDDLLTRQSRELSRRAGVRRVRARLARERDEAAAAMLKDSVMRSRVLGELRMLRARVGEWRFAESGGIDPIAGSLERLYRQGRMRRQRAERGSGDRTHAMHLWRKCVKDLRYAAEVLNARGMARRADDLGELIGEEHDLAVLGERLRAEAGRARSERGAGRRTRKLLLKLIAKRRKRLRKRALRDGRALYGRSPKKFVKRVRKARARAFKR